MDFFSFVYFEFSKVAKPEELKIFSNGKRTQIKLNSNIFPQNKIKIAENSKCKKQTNK